MFKRILIAAALLCSTSAQAANVILTINIPQVRCRLSSCAAAGRVALGGASGVAVPAGTTLVRWDGATFTTAATVVTPNQVDVSSPHNGAIYDVPVGEALNVSGFGTVTATVVNEIGRYTTGSGVGSVVSSAVSVSFWDDGTRTPSSVSISSDDSFPPDFFAAVRQYTLTKALVAGANAYGLSTAALIDVVNASLAAPRAAASSGTRNVITAFSFSDTGRTTFAAPSYTEKRLAQALDIDSGDAECGNSSQSGSHCVSLAGYVRPENLEEMREACGMTQYSYLQDDCPWLLAHDFVAHYGVGLGGANRGRVDFTQPQRTFIRYESGGSTDCAELYCANLLPPEAEWEIFDIVYADLQ